MARWEGRRRPAQHSRPRSAWIPASGAAHGALALWYESIRDFAAAEKEYRLNVTLAPEDETARLNLARVRRITER